MYVSLIELFPMLLDVKESYSHYRGKGEGRDDAIQKVLEEYSRELEDSDDSPQVWVGLADVTGRRKELTAELLKKAEESFDAMVQRVPKEYHSSIKRARERICDTAKLGAEAKYKKRTHYIAPWEIGDTFYYELTGAYAQKYGVEGWKLIFRKVGEYRDYNDDITQLLCFTMTAPGALPKTDKELEELGFLQILEGNEFSCQFNIKSSNMLKKLPFVKIGSFPNARHPCTEEIKTPHISKILFFFNNEGSVTDWDVLGGYYYKKFGLKQLYEIETTL